uniref:Ubiquitin-like domain-containing protein n=1 Tax=Chromera velia CCMP2878 TaxID=1169474 RepID=A0A0G4HKN5_9ALVE|eukprot:Cvel_28504.t1-p1 / transcript=Cvel_28504.t1 / gene=Cvel_28504 / organism=Chromera_velia_CCMP2878 / gene_product=hypothetical protein / transcript_product=hypothetical protein / location=Cvel_scaffold3744:11323-12000(-) / protein_length=226 / sequence_SO=supercontig / SO=protein_coding / is_pseudo=false
MIVLNVRFPEKDSTSIRVKPSEKISSVREKIATEEGSCCETFYLSAAVGGQKVLDPAKSVSSYGLTREGACVDSEVVRRCSGGMLPHQQAPLLPLPPPMFAADADLFQKVSAQLYELSQQQQNLAQQQKNLAARHHTLTVELKAIAQQQAAVATQQEQVTKAGRCLSKTRNQLAEQQQPSPRLQVYLGTLTSGQYYPYLQQEQNRLFVQQLQQDAQLQPTPVVTAQ